MAIRARLRVTSAWFEPRGRRILYENQYHGRGNLPTVPHMTAHLSLLFNEELPHGILVGQTERSIARRGTIATLSETLQRDATLDG